MPEYEEKERSVDWFWALGFIVVASTITAIIYKNYFFAGVLILGGTLLGHFANKTPSIISYELNDKGLLINDRLYLYENIKAFWVRTETLPMFFVKSERIFMPILIIPIEKEDGEEIRKIMQSKEIEEIEMKEHPGEVVMEYLGF